MNVGEVVSPDYFSSQFRWVPFEEAQVATIYFMGTYEGRVAWFCFSENADTFVLDDTADMIWSPAEPELVLVPMDTSV